MVWNVSPFAKQVWNVSPFSTNPLDVAIESISAGLQIVMKATPLPPSGVSSTQLGAWIMWIVWISRNQKIFQSRTFTPQETTLKALINAKEWQEAQRSEVSSKKPYPPPQIVAPTDAIICRWRPGGQEPQSPVSRGASTTQMERLSHLTANQSPL